MNWTKLLKSEIDGTYRTTALLFDRADEQNLPWKPATGSNWMTMGQRIQHPTNACGWVAADS